MARIRTIKPSFFRHEGLYDAERETKLPLRIAFAGLWTAADREGRFRWSARQLKLDCLPYDDLDFSRVLDALATRGFVVKYEVDGEVYGAIPSWHRHQVINNRETGSELPEPNDSNTLTREAREDDASATREVHAQAEGKGREGNKEGKGTVEFDEWWVVYPRKVAKGDALKAFKAASKKTDQATLMAGAKRYAEECRGKEATYIAHPATWLNAERWLDEPAKPTNGHGGQSIDAEESQMKARAKAIAGGMKLASVSDHQARTMVQRGYLTDEQARKAGYAA